MIHGGGDGERIVAFGRVGKPLKKRCFPAGWDLLRLSRRMADTPPHATVFKVAWCRAVSGELFDMALLSSKKRASRKSLSQPGWITLEGGFAARQCVVQDLSTTGAKVTIDDPNSLPAKLRLAFSRDARTGRRCEVVWRRGKSVGVKFVR
jgi:PilZ domain